MRIAYKLSILALLLAAFTAFAQLSAANPPVFSERSHYLLDKYSGTWETKGKIWPEGPAGKSVTVKGQSRWQTRCEGRFLYVEDSLSWKDELFESVGILGYDSGAYHFVVGDVSGTALREFSGQSDSTMKSLTLEGRPDSTGRFLRISIRSKDGNNFKYEWWDVFENGTQIKLRELAYKRLK